MWKKYKTWYAGLSRAGKAIFISVMAASFMAVAVAAQPDSKPAVEPEPSKTTQQSPKIEKKLVTEEQKIPFEETTVEDANLELGKTIVKTEGIDGVRSTTYELTLTNGSQTYKSSVKSEVTKQPVTKVFAKGTKVAIVAPTPKPQPQSAPQQSDCNPNYSGCVPNASDVDCQGGSGNGPAYTGPTRVIGVDVYDLDRDGDGSACE